MKKKVGYLGAGAWGICLAQLLAINGHQVILWAKDAKLIELLSKKREHPKFPGFRLHENLSYTSSLKDAVAGQDYLVESVTVKGVRDVLSKIHDFMPTIPPIILTSKGIEQSTKLLLPEVVKELFGESHAIYDQIVMLSGPSLAEEVMQKMPTSVVAAANTIALAKEIAELFSNQFFRVYPTEDLLGVAYGGAMKNIIAIASGISDGLGFGQNAKAALLSRGLHEIRKLSVVKEVMPQTLMGLSGLGDLCVTSFSTLSRNYRYGHMIATGVKPDVAKGKIQMVVEGSLTCQAALELAKQHHIPVPITEAVHHIIYDNLDPLVAVQQLFERPIKEEHL